MADPTASFFQDLAQRGHEPLLAKVTGSIRIDVHRGKRTEGWTVLIDRGDLAVTDEPTATCRMTADRELFNRLVTGESNAMAAMLRGALGMGGDVELLIMFQRLLPGQQP